MSLAKRRARRKTTPASVDISLTADELELLDRAADFAVLPRAFGVPGMTGFGRQRPEDFIVSESLPFEPSGSGEHLFVQIRKTGQNTRWVAKQLAEHAGLAFRAVGFAGLKDRHSVATQWFSLHLPGMADPPLAEWSIGGVEYLRGIRHSAKLRTGAVLANHFQIVVRELEGEDDLNGRLERISRHGVPNYFGPQRFGRDRGNLKILTDGGNDRPGFEARSFGLSALRSALFNGYLAGRIGNQSWQTCLPGELGLCRATGRYHREDEVDRDDLEPAGVLWGHGASQSTGAAAEAERLWFRDFPGSCAVLEAAGLGITRRPLRLPVHDLEWSLGKGQLRLSFGLARGSYATAVLREVVQYIEDVGGSGE